MHLDHLSLEEEDDKRWLVRDGRSGRSFPVAKRGIGKALHERIVQHFAKGGEAEDPTAGMEIPHAPKKLDESDQRGMSKRVIDALAEATRALNEAGFPSLRPGDIVQAVQALPQVAQRAAAGGMGAVKAGFDKVGFPSVSPAQVAGAIPNLTPIPPGGVNVPLNQLPPGVSVATMGQPQMMGRVRETPPPPVDLTIGAPRPIRMADGGIVPGLQLPPELAIATPDGLPTNAEARTRMLMAQATATPAAPTAPPAGGAPWLPPPGPAVPVDAPPSGAPPLDTSIPIQAPPRSAVASIGVPDAGMATAYREARAAEQAKADVVAQRALQDEKAAADRMARDEQLKQVWDARYQENLARTQALQADVAAGKIDPQRWWNDQSVGGNLGRKVTASIALILGGLGQAFGGGPNQALAHINTMIERDIDAQKANLGKKQGLLSAYVQQGHDLQSAKRLAMADAAGMYAAELERNKAKFAGKEAQATADSAIAELRAKQAQAYQAVYQQGFQNQLHLLDRVRLEEETQAKMQKALLDRAGLVAPGWRKNPAIPIGDDEAKAFRSGIAAGEKIKTETKELMRLIKVHGAGVGNNLGLPTDAKRRMNSLATSILLGVNTGVAKLGALAGHDVGFLTELASNPTTDLRPESWAKHTTNYQRLLESIDETTNAAAASMGLPRDPSTAIRSREDQLEAASKGGR